MVLIHFVLFVAILVVFQPAHCDWALWSAGNVDHAPFTYFESTLLVPPVPDREWQTLFMWPGLQPGSSSRFQPIDNGVLQPVLTYGYSCAPNPTNLEIDVDTTWWISAQYVNTVGHHEGFTGCQGGERMAVAPGDRLKIVMRLEPDTAVWTQRISILGSDRSVSFSKDMEGQPQGSAYLVHEYGTWGANPPKFIFSDIVLKAKRNSADFCKHSSGNEDHPGASVVCTDPVVEGTTCRIAECTFN